MGGGGEIDGELSADKRIQFEARDKRLDVANRDIAVIEAITEDGHRIAGMPAWLRSRREVVEMLIEAMGEGRR
ncbi:MAG: hypothetical protein ACP5E5_04510 [Acidobacteriaceae bacterium]